MARVNGIMTPVENGEIVDGTASGNTDSISKKKSGNTLDKEAFLKLLVAQMKYQDPLEPTSNTEYISQLATFSSLEEMQNLNATMTNMQGMNLVGKQVVVKVTSETTGLTTEVAGFVEYVQRENGKTYLVIEGNPYNIDDLVSVVDDAYVEAVQIAETFRNLMASLPSVRNLTLDDKPKVEAAQKAVNAMTAYQQGFLDVESLQKLKDLIARIEELEKNKEPGGEKPEEPDEGEGSDKVEGDGSTGGTEGGDGTGGAGDSGNGDAGTGGAGAGV